jgi:hypothetical protein
VAGRTRLPEAYVREIGGWRRPDPSDEPRSERRPGKVARSGQFLDCPVVTWVSVDSAQGQTDLRVERTGQPVRFGVRASGPGAQNLMKIRSRMRATITADP